MLHGSLKRLGLAGSGWTATAYLEFDRSAYDFYLYDNIFFPSGYSYDRYLGFTVWVSFVGLETTKCKILLIL